MRIVYNIAGFYRPAGMERVLADKANWLVRHGHEVTILTTEQKGRPFAFPLDQEIEVRDLAIGYEDNNEGTLLDKVVHYPFKQKKHRKLLEQTLKELDAVGEPVNGRMRERIAKALKVSSAQVGKIENILHNGIDEVQQAVRSGEMSISTASAVSSLPEEEQQKLTSEKPISEIKTKDAKERKTSKKVEEPATVIEDDSSFSDGMETSGKIMNESETSDEESEANSDYSDLEMFEEVPDAEPMKFIDALNLAMCIQNSLKTDLHASITFEQLNLAIDNAIADLQKLKGMI